MHHTDAIVDDTSSSENPSPQTCGNPDTSPTVSSPPSIETWRKAVVSYIPSPAGESTEILSPDESFEDDSPLADLDECSRNILRGMAIIVRKYQIPVEYLLEVIDGVAMDTDTVRFDTYEQLADYCDKVATAVGLASMHIWGFDQESPEVYELARSCGRAFQMTNILRDIREDYNNGRIYLPLDELEKFGIHFTEELGVMVASGQGDKRFNDFMRFQAERIAHLYKNANKLVDCISPDARRLFRMMLDIYGTLFMKIAMVPNRVLKKRIRLNRWQKITILLMRMFFG